MEQNNNNYEADNEKYEAYALSVVFLGTLRMITIINSISELYIMRPRIVKKKNNNNNKQVNCELKMHFSIFSRL